MQTVIGNVSDRRFIESAVESNPTNYADRYLRKEDLWENAREKLAATIAALAAWSRANMANGPDASDLCDLMKSVCTDCAMRITPQVGR